MTTNLPNLSTTELRNLSRAGGALGECAARVLRQRAEAEERLSAVCRSVVAERAAK